MIYRNAKLLRDARDQACSLCGIQDGTVVNAHCNDLEFRGFGIRAPDCLTAWCCRECHDLIDGRAGHLKKAEKRALWVRAFQRTVIKRFELGLWHA